MNYKTLAAITLGMTSFIAVGCGDDSETTATTGTGTGTTSSSSAGGAGTGGGGVGGGTGGTASFDDPYDFESRFQPGVSAVNYAGQSFRHTLIDAMNSYVGALTQRIDGSMNPPQTQAELVAALDYYFAFDDASSSADSHGVVTMPGALQTSWGDISSGKDLVGKFAGNDSSTDHKDWDDGVSFVGWADVSINGNAPIDSPETLLRAFFSTLGTLVENRVNGNIPDEPGTTTDIAEVYVTADGRDLKQLIQKFALMSITYSQATDDYLDDATADKGLLASNAQDGDSPYSALGHAWDEGFGYFGAARDYSLYTDDELAGEGGRSDWQGMHDTNGDGSIDLLREINWGASVNAAKRDFGSDASAMTDFTKEAFDAFVAGRTLILMADDDLTAAQVTELTGHAETAIGAWEKAIVATVIHYINDTISDTQAVGTAGYSFLDHAKHWSEMKGFALGLQFNPKSQLSDADFLTLHTLLADAPVLADANPAARTAYVTSLTQARTLLANAYGFATVNVENW